MNIPYVTTYTEFYDNILVASKNYINYQTLLEKTYLPYSIKKKFDNLTQWGNAINFCGSNLGKMYFRSYDTFEDIDFRVYTYYVIDEYDYSISEIMISNSYESSFLLNYKDYLCSNSLLSANQCRQTQPSLQCTNLYSSGDINYSVNQYIQVGTSYLDDFMYSNKSSDIFIVSLYFFIPILLFLLGMKVVRKGLFK